MAFFGDDGAGHASNALDLVFPMSRSRSADDLTPV
jgi:hypothetical protein